MWEQQGSEAISKDFKNIIGIRTKVGKWYRKETFQLTFTCSNSTIGTLEESVKYVQS